MSHTQSLKYSVALALGLIVGTAAIGSGAHATVSAGPTVAYSFTGGTDGGAPTTGLTIKQDGDFLIGVENNGANSFGTIDQFTPLFGEHTLLAFTGSTGAGPAPNAIVKGPGAYYFGTTFAGGADNDGVLYKVYPNGHGYSVLHSFTNGVDGGTPDGSVTPYGHWLYGTAFRGGVHNNGVVYRINENGLGFTVLHSFHKTVDGQGPFAAPVVGMDGMLYGTTSGTGVGSAVAGTIYRMDRHGNSFQTLYTFTGGADSDEPSAGRLIEDASGNFYGACYGVASLSDYGSVFEYTPNVGLTVLHTFDGTDGSGAFCNLVLVNGVLYGAAQTGGANSVGTLYSVNTDGTNFQILYNFGSNTGDPTYPNAGNLITAPNGLIYGASLLGGATGNGAIYSFVP